MCIGGGLVVAESGGEASLCVLGGGTGGCRIGGGGV